MEKFKRHLTVSQMAALHGINKRTLHFYDEIGLFSPTVKSENGYRYYTLEQITDLELILAFRELGMSIKEIENSLQSGVADIDKLLKEKISDTENMIEHFQSLKMLLATKRKLLSSAKNNKFDTVELVNLSEDKFVLSSKRVGKTLENYYLAIAELMQKERKYRLFNHDYGVMLSAEKMMIGNYEDYDNLYMKPFLMKGKNLFSRPEGKYLRIVTKGPWDKIPEAYEKIRDYALSNNYQPIGFAFERGLNETINSNMDEYISEIVIKIQ